MQVGIQVFDAEGLHCVFERRLTLSSRVIGTVPGRIIGAIAVYVHVVILVITLEKHCTGDVATVYGSSTERLREGLGTAARLPFFSVSNFAS
jgi:hypothetical protein